MEEFDDSGLCDGIVIPPYDFEPPHLLISKVRKSYLQYLSKVVCENYVSWCGERPTYDVQNCARHLELTSAARAMVVPLYREAIISTIKSIKQCTTNKDLHPKVEDFCIKSQFQCKSTQTDFSEDVKTDDKTTITAIKTLHREVKKEKIPLYPKGLKLEKKDLTQTKDIEDILIKMEPEPVISVNKINSSKESENVNKVSMSSDDDIMMEMEKLFMPDQLDNDEDIFDSFMCDTQVKMIMDEINQYGNDSTIVNHTNIDTMDLADSVSPPHCADVDNCIEDNADKNVPSLEERLGKILKPVGCSIVSSSQSTKKKDYVYSRWPCELFYQRKLLREKLDALCDKNIKLHAKLKDRFMDLFGYDSEDEQGLQSPDTSMEFVRSCRQRAAPHLAKHLRRYTDKMRLPRHLFSPLARHLLYTLVNINQYPSDYECYLFVKEYFKHHPKIRCQADF